MRRSHTKDVLTKSYIARGLSIESERSRVRVKTQKIERNRRRDRWAIKKINGCWRTAPSRHDTPVPSVRVFFRIPAGDSGNPLLSASCVGCSYTHTHTHTHCVCVCVCVSRASLPASRVYTYIHIYLYDMTQNLMDGIADAQVSLSLSPSRSHFLSLSLSLSLPLSLSLSLSLSFFLSLAFSLVLSLFVSNNRTKWRGGRCGEREWPQRSVFSSWRRGTHTHTHTHR